MDRREQIRTAAEEKTRGVGGNWEHIRKGAELWFIRGALWADSHPQWIPVEEELPEVGEKVIFYSPDLDDWLSGALQQDGTWWNEEYGTHFYGVTHWTPIVPPRKEE